MQNYSESLNFNGLNMATPYANSSSFSCARAALIESDELLLRKEVAT